MKKSLIALAALAAVSAASAQSSVTLSGSVAIGYAQAATNAGVESKNVAALDGFNSNNFAMTAVEDLGGGMKATAYIMQRKNDQNTDSATGDMYVQVAGAFGGLRVGQWTWASLSGYNAFGSRTASGLNGTAGTGIGGSDTIEYSTPSIGGLTIAAAMTARPTSTVAGTTDGVGVKASYANGPLAVQLISSKAATLTSGTAAKVTSLGVNYDFGIAKVFFNAYSQKAGYTLFSDNTTNARVDENGTSLSVAVPVGAATVKAGFINRGKNSSTATAATASNTAGGAVDKRSIGVDYALSKTTMLTADFASQKQAVDGTVSATTYFVGMSKSF